MKCFSSTLDGNCNAMIYDSFDMISLLEWSRGDPSWGSLVYLFKFSTVPFGSDYNLLGFKLNCLFILTLQIK